MILRGSTASISVDGALVTSWGFNAAVTDGAFGVVAKGGTASVDRFRLKTDDSAFASTTVSGAGGSSIAAATATATIAPSQTVLLAPAPVESISAGGAAPRASPLTPPPI